MIKCDALLVNQPPTTGALTRVTEFLLAGIPVIMNVQSAHSHFNMEGVTIYDNLEISLFKILINSSYTNY